jgi:hypothetical protein
LLHFADRNVRQFLVDTKSLPQRPSWDAKGQWRFDLVFRDDSSYACHYLFDNNGSEKVVRSNTGAALLDEPFYLSRRATGPHREVRGANPTRSIGFQLVIQARSTACGQDVQFITPMPRQ